MARRGWFVVVAVTAVTAAACGGPNRPTPPPPLVVGPATPPVVRSISVPASRVETGRDITITAVVEDAETPLGQLAFVWTANVGTITGSGTTATWRHAAGLQKGADVVVTLMVVDTHDAVVSNQIVKQDFFVVSQAAPFRVHDSEAELKELARKFLLDLFGNSAIPPLACLVDFTEVGHCAQGKAMELQDITENRQLVFILSGAIHRQQLEFEGAVSARVVNYAEFHDRSLATGAPGMALGDFTLTALYEGNRWWLCESTFDPVAGYGGLFDLYRRRQRDDVPHK